MTKRKKSLLPIDEINQLKSKYTDIEPSRKKEYLDDILDLLLLSASLGKASANSDLSSDIDLTIDFITGAIDRKIDGLGWRDRAGNYIDTKDANGLIRVIETESHRIFNECAYQVATLEGATQKTWNCLFQNSRDTHMYLDSQTVPIDAYFYTYNGDKSLYPGQFGVPQEDINCQCWLTFE